MPDADLQRRVEMLENTVESLRKLPADVKQLGRRMARAESQTLRLRSEMRDGFSAMRRDMVTKADLATELSVLRTEMATKAELAAGLNAISVEMATKAELVAGLNTLRGELRDGIAGAVRELSAAIAETRSDFAKRLDASQRQTRLLFEDVIARLKIIGEGG